MSTNTAAAIRYDLDELDEVVAAKYLRVSFDKSGRQRSNEEQDDEGTRAISRNRWATGKTYSDVGSASQYKRKRRVGFDELMADLEAGTFRANVLVIWEPSRGSRETWEWLRLLELFKLHGVRVYVTSDDRTFTPWKARDWKSLMDYATQAEYESMQTSERVSRSTSADAGAGRFGGGRRPFGYEPDGVTKRESEARVIREAARLVLGGKSTRWVAGALNRGELGEAGTTTSAGNPWHPGVLRKMLASPRLVGARAHHGVITNAEAWDRILDDVTHRRLVAALATQPRASSRGDSSWVLRGFLRCGSGKVRDDGTICDATMVGNTDIGGTRRYVCRKAPGYHGCGGLTIKADDVERRLGEMIQLRLVDLDGRGPTPEDDSEELADLDEIAEQRVELAAAFAKGKRAGGIDAAAFGRADEALDARQRDVERRLAAKTRQTTELAFVIAEGYVGKPWKSLDVDQKRDVLTALVSHVTVGPATKRGSTKFEAARVDATGRIIWKA